MVLASAATAVTGQVEGWSPGDRCATQVRELSTPREHTQQAVLWRVSWRDVAENDTPDLFR